MESPEDKLVQGDSPSCEPGMSRRQFVALVLKRAAVAGAILAAPKVVDKFLVAPAEARMRTSTRFRTEA
jgi:hypothetical protein